MPGPRSLRPYFGRSRFDREIGRLAIPALGALVAEPLFLLTDTALVGHLGADALAGVGLASTVLQTAVGLLIFLAYATTPTVARRVGAGDLRGGVSAGIEGMWLALALGIALLLAGLITARPLIAAFGAPDDVTDIGATYLLASLAGIPAMLVVIAATGLLRGLQDTRTTLVVASAGFLANAGLNALFIYGFGLGAVGSALGTVAVQWAMAAVYVVLAVRAARRVGAQLLPTRAGLSDLAPTSGWLFLRTLTLRLTFLATTVAASALGVTVLATSQVGLTIFFALALALDALAIAAQALLGRASGEQGEDPLPIVRRFIGLGILSGLTLAAGTALLLPFAPVVFTDDPDVRAALPVVLVILLAALPLGGFVFVLDGILIGVADVRYLAAAGVVNALVYLAALVPVLVIRPDDPIAASALLWLAFVVGLLGPRAVTLGLRVPRLFGRRLGDGVGVGSAH